MIKLMSTRPIKCWAPTIKNLKLHGARHRQWTGMLALCTKILTWVSVRGLKDSKALKFGTPKNMAKFKGFRGFWSSVLRVCQTITHFAKKWVLLWLL